MLRFIDIKQEPFKFNISYKNLNFSGIVFKKNYQFFCKGIIKGNLKLDCDSCGKEFDKDLDLDIDLILSDGIYKKNDTLDVFEFFNGEINLEEILDSEIQSLKSDYHYCEDCQNFI